MYWRPSVKMKKNRDETLPGPWKPPTGFINASTPQLRVLITVTINSNNPHVEPLKIDLKPDALENDVPNLVRTYV